MTDPAMVWPESDGDTVYTANVSFDWEHNDTTVYGWRLYVGSSAGASDYFDSGILPSTQFGVMATGLSTGVTLYVRLLWDTGGSWSSTDYTYTLTSDNNPGHTYSLRFDWYETTRWYQCDRCGFLFHESDTAFDPKSGKRVCLVGPRDYDDHEFGMNEIVLRGPRTPYYKEQD
jgi:hypothetical protein